MPKNHVGLSRDSDGIVVEGVGARPWTSDMGTQRWELDGDKAQ